MTAYFELFLDQTLSAKLDGRLQSLETLSCATTVAMKETCYILSAAEFKLKTIIPKDLWSYAFFETEDAAGQKEASVSSETNPSVGETAGGAPMSSLKQFDAKFSSLAAGHKDEIAQAKELAQSILERTKHGMDCSSTKQGAIYDRLSMYLSGQNRSQVLRRNKLLENIYLEVASKSREIKNFERSRRLLLDADEQQENASVHAAKSWTDLDHVKSLPGHSPKGLKSLTKSHANCCKEEFERVRESKSKRKMDGEKLDKFLQRNFIGPGFEDTFTPNGVRVCRKIEPDLTKTIALKTAEEDAALRKVQSYYNHSPMDEKNRAQHVKKIVEGTEKPHYLHVYKEPKSKSPKKKSEVPPMLFGTVKSELGDNKAKTAVDSAQKKLYSTSQERRHLVQRFLSGEDIFTHLKPTAALASYSASRSKSPRKTDATPPKPHFGVKKVDKQTFASTQGPANTEKLSQDQRKALIQSFLSNPKENVLSHQICTKTPREKVIPGKVKPFVPSGSIPPPAPLPAPAILTTTVKKQPAAPRQTSTIRQTLAQTKPAPAPVQKPVVPPLVVKPVPPPQSESGSELPLESASAHDSPRTKVD